MPADDQLTRWIDDLRTRHVTGALDGLAPFDLGDGSAGLSGTQTVRVMLADLDHLNDQLAAPIRRSVWPSVTDCCWIDSSSSATCWARIRPAMESRRANAVTSAAAPA